MSLRTGWFVLAASVVVAIVGGQLPKWPGAACEVLAFCMSIGVVLVDARALRRPKWKAGGVISPDVGATENRPMQMPRTVAGRGPCFNVLCGFADRHTHGQACDVTCTTCEGGDK